MGRGPTRTALLAIVSLLAAALPLSLVVASATPAGAATPPYKIMPLGDSITRGNHDGNAAGNEGGYRISLEDQLTAGGYSFDFVGTKANGPGSLADKDHEGNPGYTIQRIRDNVFTYLAKDPDVVLLHIGTNDIGDEGTGTNTDTPIPDSKINEFIGRLSALVTTILNNSDATIIVAKITPWKIVQRADGNTPCRSGVPCINDYLAAKHDATRRYNDRIPSGLPSSSRIKVVDMFTNFSRDSTPLWLDDDQHPNLTGYNQMAGRWYPVLKNVLDSFGTPPVTPPGAPTNVNAVAGNGQATVSFQPPTNNGGAAITQYRVTAVPGGQNATGNGAARSLTVAGLTNGTSYRFDVTATNSAGRGPATRSNAVTPTAPPAGGTYLSDLNASSGSGTFQRDRNINGGPIVLNGQSYAKGIGVNSITTVTYALNGQYKNFITDVGIDDSCTGGNKANIQIVVDGQIVGPTGASAIFTTSSPTLPLNLDVTGKSSLSLTASGAGDGTLCDRIDWADARLTTTTSSATAPGAPTIGTATAGDAKATVRWTAPASNGGSAINAYIVYNGSTTTNPVAFTNGSASQVEVTGLTNGTPYQFTVRAQNSVGLSAPSALSDPVTPQAAPATAPGAPTIGTATAGDQQATVRWTPPANDGGSPITQYEITSSPATTTQTVNAPATSFTFPGLTNNQAYTFTVKARNAQGLSNASAASNPVTPNPPPPPTVPDPPIIGTATAGDQQATVRWTPPANDGGSPITQYEITSSPATTTQTVNAPATSFTFPGLTNNQAYTFTVKARNAHGLSNASAASNPVTPSAPSTDVTYLSDFVPPPTTSGAGRYWNDDDRVPGTPIKLKGQAYPKGVQAKPNIALTYSLAGGFTRFQSDIGVDDACGPLGSVRFKVFLDGAATPAYDSFNVVGGPVTGNTPKQTIDLDVSNKNSIKLELTIVNTSQCHYSDWADAKLLS